MKVVAVEPLRGSYVKEIPSGLKSLQHEVAGDIEVIYPLENGVALICNEEGKIIGFEPNRVMTDEI